jgi:hypothetical protein
VAALVEAPAPAHLREIERAMAVQLGQGAFPYGKLNIPRVGLCRLPFIRKPCFARACEKQAIGLAINVATSRVQAVQLGKVAAVETESFS